MDKSHRPHIVAFTGPHGSGKSTAAKGLWPDYVRHSFAEPLRLMIIAAGICTLEQLTDPVLKETSIEWLGGRTPRYILQTLGTEWGRDMITKDIWVQLLSRKIDSKLALKIDVTVDDVRFDEEAEMIQRKGGVIIHIAREGHKIDTTHPSEHGISRKYVDRIVHMPLGMTEKVFQEFVCNQIYNFGGQPPSNS